MATNPFRNDSFLHKHLPFAELFFYRVEISLNLIFPFLQECRFGFCSLAPLQREDSSTEEQMTMRRKQAPYWDAVSQRTVVPGIEL